jgi:tetratricopeptide (TPR) repeat protein
MNSSRMLGVVLLAAATAGVSLAQSTAAPQSLPPAGSQTLPPAGSQTLPPAGSQTLPPAGSQSLPPAGSASSSLPPVAPKAKSQKEVQAIQAVQTATDPDAKLEKIDFVLTNFADTEFKDLLLDMAVQTAEQKGDTVIAMTWAQRDLDNNPNSYVAHLAMADDLASTTKEFDLDKQEKLAKAETDAKAAIAALKDAPKPMPSIADAQWAEARKQYTGEGWQILAAVEVKRKNYDAAITDYKTAIEISPNPNAEVRLGDAYSKEGKYDEAIVELDKALADPTVTPQVKNVATSLKNMAVKLKAAGIKPSAPAAPAAAPASAPAPAPAEAKP